MLIPAKDAKSYGAIHVDNYLSFIGFCKKVDSEDIQTVDVYLDNKKIHSIQADKNIEKIEELYDIENHAFKYELPEEYIGKVYLLQFKCSEEELVNSPMKTISKDNPKFNEYRFLHSLEKVNPEEVKDLYCPNSIGFLATEENLNSSIFIQYIKELNIHFPNLEIKAFYSKRSQENILLQIFDNIKMIPLLTISQMIKEIEFFIWDLNNKIDLNLVKFFLKNCNQIYTIFNYYNPHPLNLKDKTLFELDEFYKNDFFLKNAKIIGFSEDEIMSSDNSYHQLIYGTFISRELNDLFKIDLNLDAQAFMLFTQLEYIIKFKDLKKSINKIYKIKNNVLQ